MKRLFVSLTEQGKVVLRSNDEQPAVEVSNNLSEAATGLYEELSGSKAFQEILKAMVKAGAELEQKGSRVDLSL